MKKNGKRSLAWLLGISILVGSFAEFQIPAWAAIGSGERKEKASLSDVKFDSESKLNTATDSNAKTSDYASESNASEKLEVEEIKTATASDASSEYCFLTSDGITVIIDTTNVILPEDTDIRIVKVAEEKQQKISGLVQNELDDENSAVSKIYAYDISFWSEGKEFEPRAEVKVTFLLSENKVADPEMNPSEKLKIFHVSDAENKAEIMSAERQKENEISCLVHEFSIYGVAVTSTEYLLISNAKEFDNIRNNLSGNYRLDNNIDLSLYENWSPIGTADAPFKGIIDGNGFIISNLVIDSTEPYVGLFGYAEDACFQNLCLDDCDINVSGFFYGEAQQQSSGSMAGFLGQSTVENCKANNIKIMSQQKNVRVGRNSSIGGLVGDMIQTRIERSSVNGELASENFGSIKMGGIVGSAGGLNYILQSSSDVQINVYTRHSLICRAGGILGFGISTEVRECYNSGNINIGVSASDRGYISVGGIAGYGRQDIIDCYNSGRIEAIIRQPNGNAYTSTLYLGGIVGYGVVIGSTSKEATIENCYNLGNFNFENDGENHIGGIVGYMDKSSDGYYSISEVRNSYFANSKLSAIGNGTLNIHNVLFTTVESMQKQDTFIGFDFNKAWEMGDDTYPYPILQWQKQMPEQPDLPDAPDENEPLTLVNVKPSKDQSGVQPTDEIVITFNKKIETNYDITDSSSSMYQSSLLFIKDYDTDEVIFEIPYNKAELFTALGEHNQIRIKDGLLESKAEKCYIYIPPKVWVNYKYVDGEGIRAEYFEGIEGKEEYSFSISRSRESHILIFDSNGGSAIESQRVFEREPIQFPNDPIKAGWIFDGWYKEKELTNRFDFKDFLTEDLVLYAKWRKAANEGNKGNDSGSGKYNEAYSHKTSSGWTNKDGSWSCVATDGNLLKGRNELWYNGYNGYWFFDENGVMQTGWINGHYYEENSTGYKGMEISTAVIVLGSYDFSVKFVEDIKTTSGLWYSLQNWKIGILAAVDGIMDYASGKNSDVFNAMADAYMKNPDKNKAFLAEIINGIVHDEKYYDKPKYSKEIKQAMDNRKFIDDIFDLYYDRLGNISQNMDNQTKPNMEGSFISSVKNAVSVSEDYKKAITDYTENMEYLKHLQSVFPTESTLSMAVENLMSDYEMQMINSMNSIYGSIIDEIELWSSDKNSIPTLSDIDDIDSQMKTLEKAVDKVIKTKFKDVDFGIQVVTKNMPDVQAVDKVVYSSYMRYDAIVLLQNLEKEANKANPTSQAIEDYKVAFDLAKNINLKQYENMLEYYEGGVYYEEDRNSKILFLKDEIEKLKELTNNNYAQKNAKPYRNGGGF